MTRADPEPTEQRDAALAVVASLGTPFEEATHFFAVPGGVVSIVNRQGVLAKTAFGFADVDRSLAMTTGGRFEIGSISKVFTSLVVNQLVDEGRLTMEETVGDSLAWAGLGSGLRDVTIEELLTHTSGLGAGADALADDAGEIWNARASEPSPLARHHFHYSNLGYQVLGEIVRERSGERVSELVRKRWLVPLQMAAALSDVAYRDRETLVTGSWPLKANQPWAPGDALAPAPFLEADSASGNVVATSDDMARFVMALLGASSGNPLCDADGAPLLGEELFTRMTTTLAPEGEPTDVPNGLAPVQESRYGLGINVELIEGRRCVSHGGGMVGYATFMLVDCASGFGVVVLTNANGDSLAAQLLARSAHAQMLRRLDGAALLPLSIDTTVRGVANGDDPFEGGGGVGTFVSDIDGATLEVLDSGEGRPLLVRYGAEEGYLYRRSNTRYVTTNAKLRQFALDFVRVDHQSHWCYGPTRFVPVNADANTGASNEDRAVSPPHPLVGHYRCYSPWYPEFRIFERGGALLLAAPGGVEAPSEDMELVAVDEGVMRIGADPSLPERLILGPVRDGEVVSVSRDGCWYSRVFSP